MTIVHPMFEVDKEGLAKLMARRGPSFALLELLQNAWDEASKNVTVDLTYEGDDRALLRVEDDNPAGFADLSHAYRLFADSAKKGQVTKRGRFNLGEKLVIAICDYASVETTTGTIRFDHDGRTHHPSERRKAGSIFTGLLRMTHDEFRDATKEIQTVIVPHGVRTKFNGKVIQPRNPLRSFEAVLTTEIADEDGRLKRTWRKGRVDIYPVEHGEAATIYEMGIPVVATGDRWHVDVQQKVPLNVDRDNVTPAYLRDLRRAVLNACHDLLTEDASAEKWIDDAIEDKDIEPEAINAALTLRFGAKRVAYDPTDKEANKIAASQGYTVVASRSLSKEVWRNVRAAEALIPAGRVTPSPKPYQPGEANTRAVLAESEWTDGMHAHAAFARQLAAHVIGVVNLQIDIINDQGFRSFDATWAAHGIGSARLEWNLMTLGRKWFERPVTNVEPLALLIHEMGHHLGGSDHLDRRYLNELCRIGAEVARAVRLTPAMFDIAQNMEIPA